MRILLRKQLMISLPSLVAHAYFAPTRKAEELANTGG